MKEVMKSIWLLLLLGSLVSCSKEDALSPTKEPEFGYHVPQGDHDYDIRIVDWKERCNVFILYDFDLKELYWQVTSWNEFVLEEGETESYTNGLVGENADENYVGQQLALVEEMFLNFYPDTLLRRCLPLKLLLCGKLSWRAGSELEDFYNVYNGYDYLAFNWGNESVLAMTNEQKNTFKKDVQLAFFNRLYENGKIVPLPEFSDGMDYHTRPTTQNMYERGLLGTDFDELLEDDYMDYVEAIVSTPYDVLTAEPESGDVTFKGILHEKKDVNGHILRKYTILINQFKDYYNIDLQAIGNATLK